MPAARRRPIDISAHLTPDELALLAEGRAGEGAERFRHHLSHCKSCYQAYQDAVEFRARALAGQEPHAPPELLKNGRKVPLGRGRGKRVTRPPRSRMIAGTIGALAALAALWIFLGPGKSGLPSSEKAEFLKLGGQASVDLQLPGASEVAEAPTYRDGEIVPSPEVQGIIGRLHSLADEQKASRDELFWLAYAELAIGNFEMARLHLNQASADSDPRFLKLRAILAYRGNDLTAAEKYLRDVLKKIPNDPEAEFNLGMVLVANGDVSGGLNMLQRAKQRDDPQMKLRAAEAIDSLSGR